MYVKSKSGYECTGNLRILYFLVCCCCLSLIKDSYCSCPCSNLGQSHLLIAVQLSNIGMSGSLQKVITCRCQNVFCQSLGSHQAVIKKSYSSHQTQIFAVIRFHEFVIYYKVYGTKGLFSFVHCKRTFEGQSIG